MKTLLLTAIAATSAFALAAPVQAAQGCGRGYHRAPNGRCVLNRGFVAPNPGLRTGVFYNGRGYWDGHRYWQHRERHHRGWRYF